MVLAAARKPRPVAASGQARRLVKALVFLACLMPLAWLAHAAFTGGLGANPIEATNRFLGDWALRLLLVTLAVRPVKEVFGLPALMRYRRMLGLFAFFYACLHLASYVGLDQFFAWDEIWADIVKRNFITVGMVTLLLLTPLAVTSTNGMIKRLGAARWKRLHQLVYPAAALACLHYLMMVKADIREPLLYGGVLTVLLGYRVVAWGRRSARRTEVVAATLSGRAG